MTAFPAEKLQRSEFCVYSIVFVLAYLFGCVDHFGKSLVVEILIEPGLVPGLWNQ
jgi:hypothetical protein